jgi:hypothetical protein
MQVPVKDTAYHRKSIRLSLIRESLGGVKAADSYLFDEAITGLILAGEDAAAIVEDEIAKLRGKAA